MQGPPSPGSLLITEAERIAQSITNDAWRAFALFDVAEALAATNPDRAEHIAQSIPRGAQKALALIRIAKALATTDSARADRLMTDAERVARSIP